MTPDIKRKLRNMLRVDESYQQYPYTDTTGHLTIGCGRNLSDRGILYEEALTLLDNDISYFSDMLKNNLPFFSHLDEVRQIVLINMCFNLGVAGLLGFVNMIEAIADKDYNRAAAEMMDSRWSEQVKGRATRLAEIMRSGQLEAQG